MKMIEFNDSDNDNKNDFIVISYIIYIQCTGTSRKNILLSEKASRMYRA